MDKKVSDLINANMQTLIELYLKNPHWEVSRELNLETAKRIRVARKAWAKKNKGKGAGRWFLKH